MRRVIRIVGALALALALAVAAGTLIPRPLIALGRSDEPTRRILVLQNPIHTDIAIPLEADVVRRFAFLEDAGIPAANPAAKWVIFGWGGRAFYLQTPTWSDLRPGPVMRSFTLDRAVMHVDVVGSIPDDHPAVLSAFDFPAADFERLVAFIDASFRRDGSDPVAIPNAAYGLTDRFFEAHGSFNALLGCNTWTARALREAGLRTGIWDPLPANLAISLQLWN